VSARVASEKHVEISLGDLRLPGTLGVLPGARGLVLFAHGSGSSRLSPRNVFVARGLHQAGLATLLFDLLTEREDRVYETRFDITSERMLEAAGCALAEPATSTLSLGFFGASTGAAAALRAAAKLGPDVFAVVSRGAADGSRLETSRARRKRKQRTPPRATNREPLSDSSSTSC